MILKYKITTKFISEFDQDINKLKKDIPEFENEEIDFSEIWFVWFKTNSTRFMCVYLCKKRIE